MAEVAADARSESRGVPTPIVLAWLIAALVATMVTLVLAERHTPGAPFGRLVTWWLTSIVLLVLAIAWEPLVDFSRRCEGRDIAAWPRPGRGTILTWLGVTAVAAAPRLWMLDRFPTVVNGDEGVFTRNAAFLAGGGNFYPFGADFYTVPNLWSSLLAQLIPLVGTDFAGMRLLSAVTGIVGVLATWRLGRRLFGPEAGLLAAFLLAAMPFHVMFSRLVLNNIADATLLALMLLFLMRYVESSRWSDAALTGMFLGLAVYGYFGGRVFPVVFLVILGCYVVTRRVTIRSALLCLWAVAIGFLVIAAPMLMSFWINPDLFQGDRTAHDWIISGELLRDDVGGTLRAYGSNLRYVLLYPINAVGGTTFTHERPFLGWPMVAMLAVGLGLVLRHLRSPRSWGDIAILAVPWLMLSAGIAVVVPVFSQRAVGLAPIWAIVAGAGCWGIASLVRLIRPPVGMLAPRVLAIAAVAILGFGNVRWLASEARQMSTYGDLRTTATWDLGWRLSHGEGDSAWSSPILFAGAPFVWAHSYVQMTMMTPDRTYTDVELPMEGVASVPELPAGTILVVIFLRQHETCAVTQRYPDATIAAARSRDGQLLYYAIWRGQISGFSLADTPADTELRPVTESTCVPKG